MCSERKCPLNTYLPNCVSRLLYCSYSRLRSNPSMNDGNNKYKLIQWCHIFTQQWNQVKKKAKCKNTCCKGFLKSSHSINQFLQAQNRFMEQFFEIWIPGIIFSVLYFSNVLRGIKTGFCLFVKNVYSYSPKLIYQKYNNNIII